MSGGGAHTRAILAARVERFPRARVRALPNAGEEKEALLFAFLAREFALGRPANLPAVTGASRPALLGVLTPGRVFVPGMRITSRKVFTPRAPRGIAPASR